MFYSSIFLCLQSFICNFLFKTNITYMLLNYLQVGLQKFVPKAVLTSVKPKNLRKAIQSQFKKVAQLSEADCMLRFFELLRTQYNYHHEKFTCALGVSQLSNNSELQMITTQWPTMFRGKLSESNLMSTRTWPIIKILLQYVHKSLVQVYFLTDKTVGKNNNIPIQVPSQFSATKSWLMEMRVVNLLTI